MAHVALPTYAVDSTARILKCLGHPLRLRILNLLNECQECTVTKIHEALEVEQAVASRHLTNMADKGILARRRDGVNVLYSIEDSRALKVLACVRDTVR